MAESQALLGELWKASFKAYENVVGREFPRGALADKLLACRTVEDVYGILDEKETEFKAFRAKGQKIRDFLAPVVNVVMLFNDTGAETAAAVRVPGGKAIFVAFGVLLSVRQCTIFLYLHLDAPMARSDRGLASVLVKVLAQLLHVFALITKYLEGSVSKHGLLRSINARIPRRVQHYASGFLGNRDVADAMERLDRLTGDELNMALAETRRAALQAEANTAAAKIAADRAVTKTEKVDVQSVARLSNGFPRLIRFSIIIAYGSYDIRSKQLSGCLTRSSMSGDKAPTAYSGSMGNRGVGRVFFDIAFSFHSYLSFAVSGHEERAYWSPVVRNKTSGSLWPPSFSLNLFSIMRKRKSMLSDCSLTPNFLDRNQCPTIATGHLRSRQRSPKSDVKKTLKALPTSINATYDRILAAVQETDAPHLLHIFECIAFAERPLLVHELAEIFAVDFDLGTDVVLYPNLHSTDPEPSLLDICSSLIQIVESDEGRVVQFVHFSVQEYLCSSRLSIRRYHVEATNAHITLAKTSLSTLLLPSEPLKQAFSDYAVKHWEKHVTTGAVENAVETVLRRFLQPESSAFYTWLQSWQEQSTVKGPYRGALSIRTDNHHYVQLHVRDMFRSFAFFSSTARRSMPQTTKARQRYITQLAKGTLTQSASS
ncbi:hypothetical protein K488DRAFT_70608 [Vararia minispora EC-137]|uniref:Uncharacterized protein n=1 Tax=Vararia minispora EC-137 TaxID=1314806 RepID=A0ACB8QLF9_9AGAM|nr:hypothetical protein K488DRAFT_70608 [Vararia minispora EC-137]